MLGKTFARPARMRIQCNETGIGRSGDYSLRAVRDGCLSSKIGNSPARAGDDALEIDLRIEAPLQVTRRCVECNDNAESRAHVNAVAYLQWVGLEAAEAAGRLSAHVIC